MGENGAGRLQNNDWPKRGGLGQRVGDICSKLSFRPYGGHRGPFRPDLHPAGWRDICCRIRYGDLEETPENATFPRVFKNFNFTATIGRLRAIQVVVWANARYPGTYTISSLKPRWSMRFFFRRPRPAGIVAAYSGAARPGATFDFDSTICSSRATNQKIFVCCG